MSEPATSDIIARDEWKRACPISTASEIAPTPSRSPLFPQAVPPSRLSVPALIWTIAAYGITLFFAARYASWPAICFAGIMHMIAGGGITLGAHRYFSHASFRAPVWLENWLAFAYAVSFDRCGQGLISWVAAHKFHHVHSDQELDPHSQKRGSGTHSAATIYGGVKTSLITTPIACCARN